MHEVHPYRKAHPHSKLILFEAGLFIAFVIILLLVLGFSTNANAAAVLLAFLPSLVMGFGVIALVQTDHFDPRYNWFIFFMILIAFSLIFFLIPTPFVQGIDALEVLTMNAILMALLLLITHQSYAHEPIVHEHELPAYKEHLIQKETHVVHHHVKEEKPVEEPKVEEVLDLVHGIEDKAKALNFVVGRVYSVHHGGTERLRSKARIDKAWYQEFNAIEPKDEARKRAQAIVLLSKIKDRLELLQASERDVFGEDHTKLKKLQRSPSGSDAVIDIMVRNDKDPVRLYYDGALGFVNDALQKISRGHSLTTVVPHDPERPKEEKKE